MTIYRDLSINAKLAVIALLTCITALALACAALFVHEVQSFKHTLVRDLKAQAATLAGLSTAALSFEDRVTATEMLGELNSQPHINWAVIFKDGGEFARYKNPTYIGGVPSQAPARFGEDFEADELLLNTEVRHKGELVGTLHISAATSQLSTRLWAYGKILLVVFVASALVALFMASKLQRAIVLQVQKLADAARLVAERQDYSVRVQQSSDDELGQLTAAFNQMLVRIEAQDTALREGRERFEIAVAGARDGIWDWNLVTNERYVSSQWKAMLGYNEAELTLAQDDWLELIYTEDRGLVRQALREYLEGERPNYEVEFRMLHKDGSCRWILARGAALRDAGGKPFRMAGSHTDITERTLAADELLQTQRKLMEASRLAGMAEVATGVLHNVGNVLNSVNVSATLVVDQLRKSKTGSLVRAVDLLTLHEGNLSAFLTSDEKGRKLPRFLRAIVSELQREQALLEREAQELRKNVEHIKHIVAIQQAHARVAAVLEKVSLPELVEDAARMASGTAPRAKITIIRRFAAVPDVMVDRHKLFQILVNLINNARQALETPTAEGHIVLSIVQNDAGQIVVEVSDNGIGIPQENIDRIFSHGFTTKKTGHGFGLHTSANAAKEMGGSLSVRSPGPGRGATFRLEFPVEQRVQD